MTTFSIAKNPPSLHEVEPYCVRVYSRMPASTAYLLIILLPKWQVRRGTSVLLARRSFGNDHEKGLLCTQTYSNVTHAVLSKRSAQQITINQRMR